MHYFFSIDREIKKFLENTEITIRLTIGPNWNKYIAEGTAKPL